MSGRGKLGKRTMYAKLRGVLSLNFYISVPMGNLSKFRVVSPIFSGSASSFELNWSNGKLRISFGLNETTILLYNVHNDREFTPARFLSLSLLLNALSHL